MINLSTIEINNLGTILSVNVPDSCLLKNILPEEGNNLAQNWDGYTNIQMKEYVERIFSSQFSIAFSVVINHQSIQFTAHRYAADRAFIYWEATNEISETDKKRGKEQDITIRKEEELRSKLMESVILHTNEAVVITNAETAHPGQKIIFVNKAFTKMTGYSQEEAIGISPRKLQNEDTDRKELDRLSACLKKWEPCEITVSNSKKNGEKFWINMRIAPITDENGLLTHWISVERDVTKEREGGIEREKLLKELIQNNLELKQFSYIATHNLRAPLTNLVSICNFIKPDKITDSITLKLIEGFKTSTLHLNETLNDLINILIIKENINLITGKLDFQKTLDKVKAILFNTLIDESVIIDADFSEASSVNFSNIYLESIFLNLITNSINYRGIDRYPIIKINTKMDADGKTIFIFSDNGVGMNMERVKDKIFGLYQRFHGNANSKGIGLYLIHSQITALGGKIDMQSEENVGTTFIVTFS